MSYVMKNNIKNNLRSFESKEFKASLYFTLLVIFTLILLIAF